MDLTILRTLLLETGVDPQSAVILSLFLLLIPAIALLTARVRAGRGPQLRPIPGYEALPQYLAESMETGRPLHASVGVRGLTDGATAQTLAGLTTLEYVAAQTAIYDGPLIVTVADPTALPVAQDIVRREYAAAGQSGRTAASQVRLYGPQSSTYAAGVMGSVLSRENPMANVMFGAIEDEYLLIGETARRKGIPQVIGSGVLQALPFIYTSADFPIIGEETFAAGAYLGRIPSHIASLIAEDWMRIIIVLVIVVGIVLKTVQ